MMKYIIGVIAMWLLASACYYHKEELLYPASVDCTSTNSKYGSDVLPIIQSSCAIAGCHDAASVNAGGPLINYEQIKAKSSQIKVQVLSGAMPQNSSLSALQLRLISCWIDSGSPNN